MLKSSSRSAINQWQQILAGDVTSTTKHHEQNKNEWMLGRMIITSATHSGGPGFKSRPGDRLSQNVQLVSSVLTYNYVGIVT